MWLIEEGVANQDLYAEIVAVDAHCGNDGAVDRAYVVGIVVAFEDAAMVNVYSVRVDCLEVDVELFVVDVALVA